MNNLEFKITYHVSAESSPLGKAFESSTSVYAKDDAEARSKFQGYFPEASLLTITLLG